MRRSKPASRGPGQFNYMLGVDGSQRITLLGPDADEEDSDEDEDFDDEER
ncbi:MAG: hypothetical protein ACRELG_28120 [Gemmataceae bacterium]